MVTKYTEHTRLRNMEVTFRGNHNQSWNNYYIIGKRSRNMEAVFRGNHESVGSERGPFLHTTSGLPKMKETNWQPVSKCTAHKRLEKYQ